MKKRFVHRHLRNSLENWAMFSSFCCFPIQYQRLTKQHWTIIRHYAWENKIFIFPEFGGINSPFQKFWGVWGCWEVCINHCWFKINIFSNDFLFVDNSFANIFRTFSLNLKMTYNLTILYYRSYLYDDYQLGSQGGTGGGYPGFFRGWNTSKIFKKFY